MSRFWSALLGGRIVSEESIATVFERHRDVPDMPRPAMYGMGFFRPTAGDLVYLAGKDVGVSFASHCDRSTETVCTVVSNTHEGAWPIVELLIQ